MGDRGILALIIVEVGPEEVRRALSFRRHELTVAVLLGALDVACLRPLACDGEQGFHVEDPGHHHRRNVAAVELGRFVANNLLMKRWRIAVEVPALDAKATFKALYDGRF